MFVSQSITYLCMLIPLYNIRTYSEDTNTSSLPPSEMLKKHDLFPTALITLKEHSFSYHGGI